MGTISRIGPAARPATRPAGALRRVLAAFSLWRLRVVQRRHLAELAHDPHMLRDLGLTEHDAAREIRKLFWQS